MIKSCSKCGEKKQYPENFRKGGKKKDGSSYYYSYCKICDNKRQIEYKSKTRKKYTPHGTPKENLVGKKFGQLIVIEYAGIKQLRNYKGHIWLCKCDCGNNTTIMDSDLKTKHTKSCGCLSKRKQEKSPLYKGYKEISGTTWSKIKRGAKQRNIEFNITIKYAWNLFSKQNNQCSLSGLYIDFSKTRRENNTASLDRINNSKGYIQGNVQWVHKDVNIIKQFYSQDYFIFLCNNISNNNIK